MSLLLKEQNRCEGAIKSAINAINNACNSFVKGCRHSESDTFNNQADVVVLIITLYLEFEVLLNEPR